MNILGDQLPPPKPGDLVYARLCVVASPVTMPWGESVAVKPCQRDGRVFDDGPWLYLNLKQLISPREARALMEQRT